MSNVSVFTNGKYSEARAGNEYDYSDLRNHRNQKPERNTDVNPVYILEGINAQIKKMLVGMIHSKNTVFKIKTQRELNENITLNLKVSEKEHKKAMKN